MGIEEDIAPGNILLLYVSFPHEDIYHDKYFVVVDNADYPLLLKLNTSDEVNGIARRKKESCFRFKKAIYPKLDYDRFIDCGTPWEMLISKEEIIRQVGKDSKKRFIGNVTLDHKRELIARTNKSRSFSAKQRQRVREFFAEKTSPA